MTKNKEFVLKSDNISETKEQLILELLKLRKKAKVTQIQLSKLTNLPQATISRVESLNSDVTLNTLTKYAEAFGVELSIVLKPKSKDTLNKENLLINNEKKVSKYVVALQTGGLMEDPYIDYDNYQFIEAKTSEEAVEIYNKKNNCSYFSGSCVGILSQTQNEILLPSYLSENLLEDIDIYDDDEIYLLAEIDGGYQEAPEFTYSNFNILKLGKNYYTNDYSVVGKYNKEKNTFEIPLVYMNMISSLVNECDKKSKQKKKIK